jgi:hypothetical protein
MTCSRSGLGVRSGGFGLNAFLVPLEELTLKDDLAGRVAPTDRVRIGSPDDTIIALGSSIACKSSTLTSHSTGFARCTRHQRFLFSTAQIGAEASCPAASDTGHAVTA